MRSSGRAVERHVVVLEVELAEQQLEHLGRHAVLDLEAHGPAEPAAAQLHLDRGEQVVGLLLLEREVGVAGDAERPSGPRRPCPGTGVESCAAITCSSGTKRSPSGSGRNRGSSGGTFTRAKRRSSGVGVARPATPRFSDRFEMYGNGWPGSTASGVSTGKIRCSNTSIEVLAVVVVEVVPVDELDARRAQRRHQPVEVDAPPARARARSTRSLISIELLRRRCGRRASGRTMPAATWSFSAATRTWKNSSRFELKMAQNLTRSSSGTCGSSASASTRALKSSQESSRFRMRARRTSATTSRQPTCSADTGAQIVSWCASAHGSCRRAEVGDQQG